MQNSTETLHTCPTCNTPGFTQRGFKAHRCKGTRRADAPPRETIPAAPGGSESKSDMILAPGISFRPLMRTIKQHRPATFRIFWGAVLDANPRLRAMRDKSGIILTRAELKRMLEEAFISGGLK